MTICEKIGTAAMYEQLAEECAELAQAALKYARIKRGENPTPKTRAEAKAALLEEIADVELCVDLLPYEPGDAPKIDLIKGQKNQRWRQRLGI